MSNDLPPLMESRKLVAAARPPAMGAPSTRTVLGGLRRLRPPGTVLFGFAVCTLVSLALVAAAVYVVYRLLVFGPDNLFVLLVFLIPFTGIPLALSFLAWRGTKQLVHLGEYDGAFFIARLWTVFCAVGLFAFVQLVVVDGREPPLSFLAVPGILLLLWSPAFLLKRPSARAWPDRTRLRRGVVVRDAEDAQLVAAARWHSCEARPPLIPHRLVPVQAETGGGWVLDWACRGCGGYPAALFQKARTAGQGAVRGSDWMALTRRADEELAGLDPAALPQAGDEQLRQLRFVAHVGVRATRELLALIRPRSESVPLRQMFGPALAAPAPDDAWLRTTLTDQLTRRTAVQQVIEAEVARRS